MKAQTLALLTLWSIFIPIWAKKSFKVLNRWGVTGNNNLNYSETNYSLFEMRIKWVGKNNYGKTTKSNKDKSSASTNRNK